MLSSVDAGECLRVGREVYVRRPLPLILGWAIAAGLVVLFVVLIPQDLSSGLQIGATLGGLALLRVQLIVLRSLGVTDALPRPALRRLRDWASAFGPMVVTPLLFRMLTFYTWFALPFSGALMYVLYSYGIGSMFLCGRLDLLIFAIVLGTFAFVMTCGFLFAPVCAVLDSIGPLEAMRRSWRMAGGHRKSILRIAVTCFWLPISLALSAYFLSVLESTAATFRGLPAVLWIVSLVTIVVVFGPWFSGALTALFVPLKREEDGYVRRRLERKAAMNLPPSGNRGS
jgi:hypothetical protein